MGLLNADGDLVGKQVVCGDGRRLGTIVDLQIDGDAWYVRGLRVRVRREVLEDLGVARPLSSIRVVLVSTRQVQRVSDQVLLSPHLEELVRLAFPERMRGDDEHVSRVGWGA